MYYQPHQGQYQYQDSAPYSEEDYSDSVSDEYHTDQQNFRTVFSKYMQQYTSSQGQQETQNILYPQLKSIYVLSTTPKLLFDGTNTIHCQLSQQQRPLAENCEIFIENYCLQLNYNEQTSQMDLICVIYNYRVVKYLDFHIDNPVNYLLVKNQIFSRQILQIRKQFIKNAIRKENTSQQVPLKIQNMALFIDTVDKKQNIKVKQYKISSQQNENDDKDSVDLSKQIYILHKQNQPVQPYQELEDKLIKIELDDDNDDEIDLLDPEQLMAELPSSLIISQNTSRKNNNYNYNSELSLISEEQQQFLGFQNREKLVRKNVFKSKVQKNQQQQQIQQVQQQEENEDNNIIYNNQQNQDERQNKYKERDRLKKSRKNKDYYDKLISERQKEKEDQEKIKQMKQKKHGKIFKEKGLWKDKEKAKEYKKQQKQKIREKQLRQYRNIDYQDSELSFQQPDYLSTSRDQQRQYNTELIQKYNQNHQTHENQFFRVAQQNQSNQDLLENEKKMLEYYDPETLRKKKFSAGSKRSNKALVVQKQKKKSNRDPRKSYVIISDSDSVDSDQILNIITDQNINNNRKSMKQEENCMIMHKKEEDQHINNQYRNKLIQNNKKQKIQKQEPQYNQGKREHKQEHQTQNTYNKNQNNNVQIMIISDSEEQTQQNYLKQGDSYSGSLEDENTMENNNNNCSTKQLMENNNNTQQKQKNLYPNPKEILKSYEDSDDSDDHDPLCNVYDYRFKYGNVDKIK